MNQDVVLSVQNLSVTFTTPDGVVRAVTDLSFDLHRGETLSIVGESGSGKSVTAASIMRLNNSGSALTTGRILLKDVDILSADESVVRSLRGREVAMVFQDPMSALNPYYSVGSQIDEAYLVHHPDASKKEARAVTLNMLRRVGIPNPDARVDEYPHQFSGGMRQRIVIAIALINNPSVLIADEPTTALDVTVQAQILDLMMELQEEFKMAIILITHDLGVVAEVAQDVIVMYGGRVVERSTVEALFAEPVHPYASGLLNAVTSLEGTERGALETIPGAPPSMISIPTGCSFHPRCSYNTGAGTACTTVVPVLRPVGRHGSLTACHLDDNQLVTLRSRRSA